MSAAEPLRWTRAFDRRGALDGHQTQPPHLQAVAGIAERALDKMVSDQAPGLADFDAPAHRGARRPGTRFWRDFARAVDAVEAIDQARIDGKAHTGEQWAELVATPALGDGRHRKLLRIGGKLRQHGLPPEMVLAELLIHNRGTCCPPLAPHEVEPLWRWVLERHEERTA